MEDLTPYQKGVIMMEEVAKQYSKEALKKALEWVKGAESFAAEQTPQLIYEILYYHAFESIVAIVISIAIFGVCAYAIKKCNEMADWESNDPEKQMPFVLGMVVASVSGLVSGGLIIKNTLIIGKIYFAPRLYLIEYLTNLIN